MWISPATRYRGPSEGAGTVAAVTDDAAVERSWALPAAAAVLALENVGILAALLFLRTAPPLVPLFLLAKFPFCVRLVQRRHGAFMLLTFWEATTFVVGIINPALDLVPRLVVLGSSAAGLGLLGMSIGLFPETHLPHARPPDGSLH